MEGVIVYFYDDYNCCTSQDELRKAKKKMGEQNLQRENSLFDTGK